MTDVKWTAERQKRLERYLGQPFIVWAQDEKRERDEDIGAALSEITRLTARIAADRVVFEESYVDFYEREFYPLSNFSAFTLSWWVSPLDGYIRFDTSEAAYHYEKVYLLRVVCRRWSKGASLRLSDTPRPPMSPSKSPK